MPTRHTLKRAILGSLFALATTAAVVTAQADPSWTKPYPPFHIAGNLYYVGSAGLANYLITTPQGHILINSDLEANVPMIRASVEQLGFKFGDIKILLISHAHWDHNAGSAMIKQLTGAKYMVMDADVSVVESGGKTDFQPADIFLGAHGGYFGMEAKYERMKAGAAMPFVDPEGYKKYVDEREKAFRNALARQQKTGDRQ